MITPVKKEKREPQPLLFNGFPRGLNTAVPPAMITNEELAECVDWKYNSRGQLESRSPITRYTNMGCTQENLFGAKYRTFSTWDTVTAGVAKNSVGIDDVANTASTLTDSSAAAIQSVTENFTIIDDSLSHTFLFAVKVDSDATRYPLVSLSYKNGGTELTEEFLFSTVDGSSTELTAEGTYSLTVFDGWIFGKVSMVNNGSGNTEASCVISPAASSNGSSTDVATQGSIIADWCLFCNGDSDAEVATIGSSIIDGTNRSLVCDENDVVYYLLNNTLTEIDTAEGEAQFISYNNTAVVLDGSYIKYLDDLSGLKIAYDTGENFFDEYATEVSDNIAITTAGVGCTFTTPSWDAGYTIPPTTVTAKVLETTAGTGTIEASFWDVSGSAEVAASSYTLDIAETLDYIDITFTSSDITSELEPSKEYYCLLKGANVELAYETVSSGGTMITGGDTPDTTKNPIMRINPGRPPKASFGCLSDKRPFVAGDPDNPGKAHYGKLSIFEWGSLTSVDDDATSYEIGGMEDLYGDLRVYGTEDQPYLAILEGDVEVEWKIKRTFQEIWTLPKTLTNVGNDLWCSNRENTYPLSGVQEYGDVRFSPVGDNISDKFIDEWDDSAFAAYYPRDSQYWLCIGSKVMICHTKRQYNPWTEYDLPITQTAFKQSGSNFFIGETGGNLYIPDREAVRDLDTDQIYPKLKTAYVHFPFREVNLSLLQFVAQSLTGSGFDLDIYINGKTATSVLSINHLLPVNESLTIDELTMTVDEMDFSLDSFTSPPKIELNINCWSAQIGISNVVCAEPVFFSGFFLKQTPLEV